MVGCGDGKNRFFREKAGVNLAKNITIYRGFAYCSVFIKSYMLIFL